MQQIPLRTRLQIKMRKYYYLMQYHVQQSPLGELHRKHLNSPRVMAGVFALVIVCSILVNMLTGVPVRAQTKTFTGSDILDGTHSYSQIQVSQTGNSFSLQSGDIGQWSGSDNLPQLPTMARSDYQLVYGPNSSLYVMVNMSGCRWMRFNEDLQQWQYLHTPPVGCGPGFSVVYDGNGTMYYFGGDNSNGFFKYDIDQDSWSSMPDAPVNVGAGGSATYVSTGAGSIYLMRGASSSSLVAYDFSTGTWSTKAAFPTTGSVQYGLSMVWGSGDTIYAIGQNGGEFKKYSISTNTWTSLASANGSGCPRHGLMLVQGSVYDIDSEICWDTTIMQRYDPGTNTWTDMPAQPGSDVNDYIIKATYDGSDSIISVGGYWEHPVLYRYSVSGKKWYGNTVDAAQSNKTWSTWKPIYDGGNYAYYFGGWSMGSMDKIFRLDLTTGQSQQIGSQYQGNSGMVGVDYNNALYLQPYPGNNNFYKYDLGTGDFTQLANMPANSNWGSDMVDGGDGYLYAVFGYNNIFYRYSEASGWQQLASMPQSVGSGGGMTRIGSTIYVMAASQRPYMMKYNMSTNAWTYTTDTPNGTIDHGAFLTSDNSRYLYADLGTRTDPQNSYFYRFDTTNSTWKRMADMPQSTQVGSYAFYDSAHSKIWAMEGNIDSQIWSWSPSSANYVTSGNWYSKPLDLTQVQSWSGLTVNSSGTGTVTVYTRTSTHGNLWTDWQATSGSTINSPPNRYLQIKISLSGDGTASPSITGLTLNYNQEAVPPNLPSQFTALSAKGGQPLTTGQKYPYEHPYFSWNGADDGANGSGVAGYYIYFGTDSNADPTVDGSYQTNTDYTVTTAMSAGTVYYVRIKVKDKLGNISDVATFFSYLYYYISPPGSQLVSGKSEISAGLNTGLNIATDGTMSLLQQTNGAWSVGSQQQMPNNSSGGAMAVANGYVYTLRGSTSSDFWRYDPTTGSWLTLASYPVTVGSGSAITWDQGNYLYATAGRGTNAFYRYNILNNVWESLPILPVFAQPGSDMKYIGNGKLAFLNSGTTEFYIYDIASQGFSDMAATPQIVNNGPTGSGMWWDGGDYIYVYFGPYDRYQWGRNSLARYTISQDVWRDMSVPPTDAWYGEKDLVGDGQGNLYVFGNDYYLNQSSTNIAEKYNIATDTWSSLPNFTGQVVRGTATSDGQRYLYIIPSIGNSRKIIQYDTWDNRFLPEDTAIPSWQRMPWDDQSSYDWQAGNATSAVYDGTEYIYAIGGNEGTSMKFMRRSVETGETDYLMPPPYAGIGASLAWQNGTLYYTPAYGRTNFYKYDFNSGNWVSLASVPAGVNRPGASSLISLKDGTLLQVIGNSNALYKYDPGTNAWTKMANAPSSLYQGGSAYDGNNLVYVAAGNNNKNFYSYNVSTNTWSTLAAFPLNENMSVPMMVSGGKVYAAIGNNTVTTEVYDIGSNSWTQGPDAPDYFRYGSVFVPINNQYADVIVGQDSTDVWRFDLPGSNQAYSGMATHISQPMQIDGLFDYAGVQAQVNLAPDTKIEIWTRTSSDGTNWNNWTITDNVKYFNGSMSARVASTPQKFTQLKFILYSFDNLYTPSVSNYSLDYYFDVTPPTDPTVETTYTDSTKTAQLSNNAWHNNASPLFDWPDPGEAGGATDGPLGSNIKGYYVYLGADPTAVPQTSGVFVPKSEYTPTLTTPGIYYLRIQAVDMTNNVDSNIFAPYIYKFDNVPPTNPTLITATPGGFTSTNKYTFQWPNGFDNDSGVDAYCFHTGALTGPFAVETCQSQLSIADISAAYQSGTNIFYLRTRDVAGNYSPSYTEVSYYYSTDPPSPVTNLRAVPPTSTQNLFAYVWDLPSQFSGDPTQLTYCYSINTLPTPTNTTCTTDQFLSAFKAATQQGTNIMYMVAKDEAGNVNWNNYASANFIANTVSPGIPLNLVVSDTSDTISGRYSLTLTWDPPTFAGNGIAQYIVERSDDDHTFEEIGRGSNTAYVDLSVEAGKTYYYRVRAADNVDNEGGASATVAQSAEGNFASPPKIVSEPKASASFDQSTIDWVTDRASTSFVYYGTSPTQLTQSKGTLDLTTEHSMVITGLKPSTIYYFKVQSFDNNRSYDIATAYSQLYTLTTTETASIFNVSSTDTGLSSSILSWQTSVPTNAQIQYGTNRDYGLTQSDDSGTTASHIYKLDNLASGTTYHYRIVATTEYGSQITSDDYTVTTVARPRITGITFQPVDSANTLAVQVSWNTNVPTSSQVDYTALGAKKSASAGDLTTTHQILISDLASSTDYQFVIQGRDGYGNLATSDLQNWRSGVDTKPPTITDMSVNATTVTGSGNAKAQLIISWHTDEPSTTQVLYGSGSGTKLDKKSPFDPQPTVDHVVVLSGLGLAQVYRIQPVTRDISGNTTYGAKLATVTPDTQQSPLDVVLNMLQRIFRF